MSFSFVQTEVGFRFNFDNLATGFFQFFHTLVPLESVFKTEKCLENIYKKFRLACKMHIYAHSANITTFNVDLGGRED